MISWISKTVWWRVSSTCSHNKQCHRRTAVALHKRMNVGHSSAHKKRFVQCLKLRLVWPRQNAAVYRQTRRTIRGVCACMCVRQARVCVGVERNTEMNCGLVMEDLLIKTVTFNNLLVFEKGVLGFGLHWF